MYDKHSTKGERSLIWYRRPKAWFKTYDLILNKISMGMAFFSGIIIFILMSITSIDVIGRYFFARPLGWCVDMSILMFIMLSVIPQAYVQQGWQHLGIEFVYERVSPKSQHIMRIIVLMLLVPIALLITVYSVKFSARNWDVYFFGLIKIPYWPGLLAISIGYGLLTLRFINQLIENFARLSDVRPRSQ